MISHNLGHQKRLFPGYKAAAPLLTRPEAATGRAFWDSPPLSFRLFPLCGEPLPRFVTDAPVPVGKSQRDSANSVRGYVRTADAAGPISLSYTSDASGFSAC